MSCALPTELSILLTFVGEKAYFEMYEVFVAFLPDFCQIVARFLPNSLNHYSTVPNISPYTIIKFLEGPKY